MKIALDYMVCLTVHVDVDSGTVEAVGVSGEDFNAVLPTQVFNESQGDEGNDLPEYLPLDHPVAQRAIKIAGGIELTGVKDEQRGWVDFDFAVEEYELADSKGRPLWRHPDAQAVNDAVDRPYPDQFGTDRVNESGPNNETLEVSP